MELHTLQRFFQGCGVLGLGLQGFPAGLDGFNIFLTLKCLGIRWAWCHSWPSQVCTRLRRLRSTRTSGSVQEREMLLLLLQSRASSKWGWGSPCVLKLHIGTSYSTFTFIFLKRCKFIFNLTFVVILVNYVNYSVNSKNSFENCDFFYCSAVCNKIPFFSFLSFLHEKCVIVLFYSYRFSIENHPKPNKDMPRLNLKARGYYTMFEG